MGYEQMVPIITNYPQQKRGSHDPIVGSVEGYLRPMTSRIAIGADHAGYELKEEILKHLQEKGMEVLDKGTNAPDSVDYPDHAHAVAQAVSDGTAPIGVVICGSANGVNITANKHHGVRSALAWRPDVARLAREHNNANVLALPARFITTGEAIAIVDAFLSASFEGGRHQRRVEKIEP